MLARDPDDRGGTQTLRIHRAQGDPRFEKRETAHDRATIQKKRREKQPVLQDSKNQTSVTNRRSGGFIFGKKEGKGECKSREKRDGTAKQ